MEAMRFIHSSNVNELQLQIESQSQLDMEMESRAETEAHGKLLGELSVKPQSVAISCEYVKCEECTQQRGGTGVAGVRLVVGNKEWRDGRWCGRQLTCRRPGQRRDLISWAKLGRRKRKPKQGEGGRGSWAGDGVVAVVVAVVVVAVDVVVAVVTACVVVASALISRDVHHGMFVIIAYSCCCCCCCCTCSCCCCGCCCRSYCCNFYELQLTFPTRCKSLKFKLQIAIFMRAGRLRPAHARPISPANPMPVARSLLPAPLHVI